MKRIWKWQAAVLLAVVALMSFGIGAQAASNFKTYEYQFKAGNGEKLNDVAPLKQMEIYFNESISALKPLTEANIYVREVGKTEKLNIVKNRVIDGQTLIITFKNIDFIDYTEILSLELVIEKEVLQFDQIEKYIMPFTISDVLPGFKSLFIDSAPDVINNKIFKENPPRDINVHIPTMYIEQIETIHRNDGVVVDEGKGPHLTNIDVLANASVTRLKTSFNDNTDEQYRRDLEPHPGLKGHGFTMGQAGIEAALEKDKDTAKSFELKAYSAEGRLLETRKFPLLVIDKENNFKYNGYLPKPDKVFGETKTLYELMADTKLLNTIMTRIPVSEFESALGVSFSYINSTIAKVANEEQLKMALENHKLKTIDLDGGTITADVQVDRDVALENGEINGEVVLNGTDTNIRLKNVNISGDLTIDVGANGTVILESVSVNGAGSKTEIISGGSNSVHLNNFTSENGIEFSNTSPLRVVTSNSQLLSFIINSKAPVTLEVLDGQVNLTGDGTILSEANKITVIGNKNDITNTINSEFIEIMEPSKPGNEADNTSYWYTESITITEDTDVDNIKNVSITIPTEKDEINLGNHLVWNVDKVTNSAANWNVTYEGITLKISNPTFGQKGTIILKTEVNDVVYLVKVDVTVVENDTMNTIEGN